MIKRILIILVFLFSLSFEAGSVQSAQTSRVWICTSSGAYAYHNNRSCSGLNNCKAKIIQVTEQEAIEKWGRRKCKKCYHVNAAASYPGSIKTIIVDNEAPFN